MRNGLLDQLGPDDRRALLATMSRRTYRKNDTLFHEGDPGDTLHVIDKGHVAIRVSTRSGDVVTLTVLGPAASFGEQALLDARSARTASAVALDSVETRTLHRRDFEALRASSPTVERFLTEMLAAQVRRLTEQLLDALYVPADQRVVRRLADVAEVYAADGNEAELALRQDDLATMAGTTRPTANRVLKQLEAEGTVELARGRISIADVAGLRRRAR
jgi:CRP-like cAMP-binding protein